MDHYVDISLLPDPEFPTPLLMSALFSKLHRQLVSGGTGNIGVSFPAHCHGVRPSLGDRLRLHGTLDDLVMIMKEDWLRGMRDHCHVCDALPIPSGATHRCVRRVQAHSSPDRARRRLITRKGLTLAEAVRAIPDGLAQRLSLPYVSIASQSTNQKFRLFIEHGPLMPGQWQGKFSSYGLSSTATVPWF